MMNSSECRSISRAPSVHLVAQTCIPPPSNHASTSPPPAPSPSPPPPPLTVPITVHTEELGEE